MRKTITALLVVGFFFAVYASEKDDNFIRGIVYYLLGDKQSAREYLDTHFKANPQPEVRIGFELLLENQGWEAAKHYNKYLESTYRPRYLEALIGVSLALSDMGTSSAEDNLNKALRLNFNYPPALICLGLIYQKKGDYPDAEMVLQKALKYSPLAETKTILAKYYLETAQAKKALDLLRPEADALPQNFSLNLLTARAALEMNLLDLVDQYTDRCLRISSQSQEAQLVRGKSLLRRGEWKKARSILENLRFKYFNLDYTVAMAEALVRLQDSDAEKFLYEGFSQSKWHPRLNRLFSAYSARKKKGNPQNWIYRALLSGNSREDMQKESADSFEFPQYPSLPFFEVKKICWLGNSTLAVAGRIKSGEGESLFVVNANPLSISKAFPYNGSIQDFFPSAGGDRLILSTTAVENERINVYLLQTAQKKYSLRAVSAAPVRLSSMTGVFSDQGNEFFFTDGGFPSLAFESPFSVIGGYGRKILAYPQFPFPVYAYNLASGALSQVKDAGRLRRIPMAEMKKYYLVADAFSANHDVESQVRKGQGLEVTSSDYVKVFFADDLSAFIIYFADLANAFQAIVYHADQNKAFRIDETMFLGKKKYAELILLKLYPGKKDIYVQTKDKDRDLIRFNYGSLLYDKVNSGLIDFFSPHTASPFWVLSEKKRYLYYSDSNLEVFTLSPYRREKISGRSDLAKIMSTGSLPEPLLFSTYNGETIKLNDDNSFSSVQVSFDGAPNGLSPDRRHAAVFINGKLFLLKWL